MIYYPIKILVNAGVDDIMIVTGGNNAGEFLKLLGNGADFGLRHLNYTYQEGEGGIAAALSLAEFFADEGKIVVVLGDNIIEKNVRKAVQAFEKQKDGARIMLKEVSDPKRFGVPVFEGDRIVRVEEKPAAPKSQYAVIGIYMYDTRVFDFIKNLKPSKRGELEITDVNNFYINEGKMEWDILDGWWSDAGTFESLQYAGNMVAKTGANKM
jgi:glucose-1-phosphate thymidylyltransferase